jgi:predicted nucleic acid-binding protein
MRFVDTNILLYAISTAPEKQQKARVALMILDDEDLALSVQVLQEFYVQAVRTSRPERLSHEQASLLIEAFLRFPVLETTVELALAAVRSAQRFGISYWHAAIIEAARILGCTVVLTEDLNDGQNYGGVRVENPFRGG